MFRRKSLNLPFPIEIMVMVKIIRLNCIKYFLWSGTVLYIYYFINLYNKPMRQILLTCPFVEEKQELKEFK